MANYEDGKPRKGRFQRVKPGPAPVHRWGHYGVTYPEGQYQTIYDWYTQNLSLATSDVVYKGEDPTTCFFHIDRGLEYTDHHAFLFKKAKPGEPLAAAHAAFEVHDFDIQQLGHNHLSSRGYRICWGVGRVCSTSIRILDTKLNIPSMNLGAKCLITSLIPAPSWLYVQSSDVPSFTLICAGTLRRWFVIHQLPMFRPDLRHCPYGVPLCRRYSEDHVLDGAYRSFVSNTHRTVKRPLTCLV